jgi:hypothetical protein
LVEVCPWNNWTGSNDFSATYWDQYQLTPTTGTTSDIYGNSSTVYKLIGSVTNSYSFINRGSNGSANTAFSVYAKPNGYTKIGISNRSTGDWNFVVDLVTKVVSNIYDLTSSIVSINVVDAVGDWKRIEVVVSTAVQYNLHPLPSNFNSTNFDNVTLNGTDGVWVMAAQVNIGSTAKPYFPTTDRLNVPRLTYQNGGGGCPSLLLEKQSTNSQTYSEQIDNAVWGLANLSVSANNTTSPDGTQNADKIVEDTANARHEFYGVSLAFNGSNAVSFYAKNAGRRYICALEPTGAGGATFDLQNGVVSAVTSVSASIENVGNGWYRCSVIISKTATTQIYYCLRTTGGVGIETYTGDGTSGVYFWGAQTELNSSYPTSYIPTTSASATRVADACFKTGISSLIGQTEGTMFIDTYVGNETDEVYGWLQASLSGNPNDSIQINRAGSNVQCQVYNGGTVDGIITGGTIAKGQRIKIAVGYKQNDLVLYLNGTQIGVDTSTNIPTCAVFQLGAYPPLPNDYTNDGGINQAVLFPTRLTNAELASLTTI